MKYLKPSLVLALALGAPAQATVIDNGQFGGNIGQIGGVLGSDAYAQSFVAPEDARLVRFGMWLNGGQPEPAAIRVDLWADDGTGNPDAGNILIEGTVAQEITGDITRFDTVTDYELVPGQRYHVVLNAFIDQNSLGNYTSTWDLGTNTIPDGELHFTNDLGQSWNTIPGGDFGVYVETHERGGCYADCDGDEELSFFDFLCFTNAFNAGEKFADCDQDGELSFFDFLCFTNAFNAGC